MTDRQFDRISGVLRLQKQMLLAYDACITQAADRVGVTKAEADVLLFLSNNPQYSAARDVVRHRGFSKTYVSRAVEQLAARGMLVVATSAVDRRLQHLRLTAGAAEPVRRLRRAQLDFFARLTEGLPEDDVAAFRRVLCRIDDRLRQMSGGIGCE